MIVTQNNKRFRSKGKIQNPTNAIIRIEKSVWKKLYEISKEKNVSRNSIVRNLIKEYVEKEENKENTEESDN